MYVTSKYQNRVCVKCSTLSYYKRDRDTDDTDKNARREMRRNLFLFSTGCICLHARRHVARADGARAISAGFAGANRE